MLVAGATGQRPRVDFDEERVISVAERVLAEDDLRSVRQLVRSGSERELARRVLVVLSDLDRDRFVAFVLEMMEQ